MTETPDRPESTEGESLELTPLGPTLVSPTPADLRRRRRRTVLLTSLAFLLILLLTLVELHLLRARSVLVLVTFNFNLTLLLLLLLLILRNVVKTLFERRQKTRGVRLRTKLVLTFLGLSLLPTGLMFVAASGLISEALENWFNPQIEHYLIGALDIAQVYTADARDRSMDQASRMAEHIRRETLLRDLQLESLREYLAGSVEEYGLSMVQVFSAEGEELARAAAPGLSEGRILAPDTQFFREARAGKEFSVITPVGQADLVRCGVPIPSSDSTSQTVGVLVVGSLIPQSLARKIRDLSRDYAAYRGQQQAIFESKALYQTVLLVLTLTIIFAATWLGFYLARTVTIPIEYLADATRRVQEGDLDFRLDVTAFDEVGLLVESFDRMTEQLRNQRRAILEGNAELSRAIEELEQRSRTMATVLEGIATGVVGLDPTGTVTSFNAAAGSLLQIAPANVLGRTYLDGLSDPSLAPLARFLERADRARWRSMREEIRISRNKRNRSFQVASSPLLDQDQQYTGMVVVLEDLTHLLKVRRIASWQEVARRIAHEIKNPLTPIQLSAQRIERRLDRGDELPSDMVRQCTGTIIGHVDDLKRLVDSFSRFARMPEANLQLGDLHQTIREVVGRYAPQADRVQIDTELDTGVPSLSFDAEQIRRLLQNLVDNGIEAMDGEGTIHLQTRYDSQAGVVTLGITDQGPGVKPEDREKLFLPYFSTKRRGTGLGLAIVARIVADHGGFIRVREGTPRGTTMEVELPVGPGELPSNGWEDTADGSGQDPGGG